MFDVSSKIKAPAIGLIVVGALNFALGLLTLLSGILRLTGIGGTETVPTDEAERIGYYFGTFFGYGVALIGLILAPIVVYGAIQMLGGRKYKLAKASAVLAIIPFASCCFVIGIPFGVWALIILGKPEVKAFFSGEMNFRNQNAPMPPNF